MLVVIKRNESADEHHQGIKQTNMAIDFPFVVPLSCMENTCMLKVINSISRYIFRVYLNYKIKIFSSNNNMYKLLL